MSSILWPVWVTLLLTLGALFEVTLTSEVNSPISTRNLGNASDCNIPNETPKGVCLPIGDCPAYQQARNSSSFNAEAVNFLKNVQCPSEVEPLVCCPQQADATYQNPFLKFTKVEYKDKQELGLYGKEKKQRSRLYNVEPPVMNATSLRRVCGKQARKRIFGGEIAELDEFPWMALLVYNTNDFGCSAVLIDDRHLLTSAHCVHGEGYRRKMGLKAVRLGEFNVKTQPDCIEDAKYLYCADAAYDVAIEQIFVHPDYKDDSVNKFDDIAMIRLKYRVPFSRYVMPICLPSGPSKAAGFTVGQMFSVAGWGRTNLLKEYFSFASPIKLKLKIPFMAAEKCSQILKRVGVEIGAKQLCAGGVYGEDTCAGDSGGPLMFYDTQRSRWMAYGILSYGFQQCGLDDHPSVYTNVAEYLDWIYGVISTVNHQSTDAVTEALSVQTEGIVIA